MEYTTLQKNITMSPRKVRLVADMVRKMDPYRALDVLQFTNKAAALPVAKAIKTVLANAGKTEGLSFVSIQIDEGLKMKRYRAGTAGRGRGRPYRRRMSHIKIVITDEARVEVGKVSKVPNVSKAKQGKGEALSVKGEVEKANKTEEPKIVEAQPVEDQVVEGEVVEEKGEK